MRARYFPANPIRKPRNGAAGPRRAVVVLAQWNSDADGHIGLCKLLSKLGIASLRISLPYHDVRMPPELKRADYIVSSNVVRTLQVCRQAVRDVRLRAVVAARPGLRPARAARHQPRLVPVAADRLPRTAGQGAGPQPRLAVFRRRGVARAVDRARAPGPRRARRRATSCATCGAPISPWSFLDRLQDTQTLLVYAKYDLSFPVDLSMKLIDEMRRRGNPLEVSVLPCGHYSTGAAPFKYLDGWYLGKFLREPGCDPGSYASDDLTNLLKYFNSLTIAS